MCEGEEDHLWKVSLYPYAQCNSCCLGLHQWTKVYLVCWTAIVTRFHKELSKFCIPYGNTFYGCSLRCTIIVIIVEQSCNVIGPLPLFFRPLIGQNDLTLQGYLTASCCCVRFTLPDSWHTVLHVDKISSIYQSLLLTCLLWHVDQGFSWTWMVGNISNVIFHASLRYLLRFLLGKQSIGSIYKVKAPPNRNLEGDATPTTFKWSNLRSLMDKNLFRVEKILC